MFFIYISGTIVQIKKYIFMENFVQIKKYYGSDLYKYENSYAGHFIRKL